MLAPHPEPAALLASLSERSATQTSWSTYRRHGGKRVDATALPPHPEGRAVARLTRDGATYAELWYAASLDPQGDVVRAVADSSGLALEYVAARRGRGPRTSTR